MCKLMSEKSEHFSNKERKIKNVTGKDTEGRYFLFGNPESKKLLVSISVNLDSF
jgi:hypothetical protein